ncbi:helix-turn-helix domain-containing protein [Nocardia carnea]|uniref:helix-turn-helix domain-containing protein n=1 Tax=Nocardia carnea TaxID=37328 RepID=UPI002453E358|nr:helix-turn-helix domain-containing protein [Nocardia carnea]
MAASGSPPTRRVVAVIELLAQSPRALTVSEIVDRLALARATVTAVLTELCAAQWVTRDASLAYRPGPALSRLAGTEAVEAGGAVGAELAALAEAAACGATLSRIAGDRLTIVAKHYAGETIVPGLSVGQSIPLAYPAGAAVMPWRPADERERWLRSAAGREGARDLLYFVTTHGFAMFRPKDDDAGLVDVLTELFGALGAELLQPALRAKLLRQLSRLTSRAYTTADIATSRSLPVSYVSAPVFRGDEVPYEVQFGPLRAEVGPADRERYAQLIKVGAQAISVALEAGEHTGPGLDRSP